MFRVNTSGFLKEFVNFVSEVQLVMVAAEIAPTHNGIRV